MEQQDSRNGLAGTRPPDLRSTTSELPKIGKVNDNEDKKKAVKQSPIAENLPPMSDIKTIFEDLVKRAMGLRGNDPHLPSDLNTAASKLTNRVFRVGTMCSGTESPILALQLIFDILKQTHQTELHLEHAFSAEIEPFKQAYIERNFAPPLLFRDVTEFGANEDDPNHAPQGTTAYGGLSDVPLDIDLLVAGASCVDLSNLNNNRAKKLSDGFESKNTFNGVKIYCKKASPPIVILENVRHTTVWKTFQADFEDIGYAALYIPADTKQYYLPQTRERQYMICIHKQKVCGGEESVATEILSHWATLMQLLQRPASSSLSNFLLPPDDLRALSLANKIDATGAPGSTSWEACRGIHQKVRDDLKLGYGMPIGYPYRESSDTWLQRRPGREIECLNLCYLRWACFGSDANYKEYVVDSSQSADRCGGTAAGLSGCVTPRGHFWMTEQARRLSGYEALALQGILIDQVDFTMESDMELGDLAGNAMSSTVVGAAILSALIACHQGLLTNHSLKWTDISTEIATHQIKPIEGDKLALLPMSHGVFMDVNFAKMLDSAAKSLKLCVCEGQTKISRNGVKTCTLCAHTVCQDCVGSPAHMFSKMVRVRHQRIAPADFEKTWSPYFPDTVEFHHAPLFDKNSKALEGLSDVETRNYFGVVHAAFRGLFTFRGLNRTWQWQVTYKTSGATLQLVLSTPPIWQLFAHPDPEWPVNSPLRPILDKPVARSIVGGALPFESMPDHWEWFDPSVSQCAMTVSYQGEERPSWNANLGILKFQNQKIFTSMQIEIPGDNLISGVYQHLPDCGTAFSCLYKKDNVGSKGSEVFLFLDPHPYRTSSADTFVFSPTHRRLARGEWREILATIDSHWRPWEGKTTGTKNHGLKLVFPGSWKPLGATCLQPSAITVAHYVPDIKLLRIFPVGMGCRGSAAILRLEAKVPVSIQPVLRSQLPALKKMHVDDRDQFQSLGWMTRAFMGHEAFIHWMPLELEDCPLNCQTCYPRRPPTIWKLSNSKKDKNVVVPYTDHIASAKWERYLKQQPQPFSIDFDCDVEHVATMEVGLNVTSLAHRALAILETPNSKVEYNIDFLYREPSVMDFRRFLLRGNTDLEPAEEPPGMQLTLRVDQCRSLRWMREQENDGGVIFTRQHVEEARIIHLNLKVEVKASVETRVKGGILADQPSYGKTVITLALIQDEYSRFENAFHAVESTVQASERSQTPYQSTKRQSRTDEDSTKKKDEYIKDGIFASFSSNKHGLINAKATLIVTPTHLVKQWHSEIKKFYGKTTYANKVVVVISTMKHLEQLTVEEVEEATIVIVNWTLLYTSDYITKLGYLAGLSEPPSIEGRSFREWLDEAAKKLPGSVKQLKDHGIECFDKFSNDRFEAYLKLIESSASPIVPPSKRLKSADKDKVKAGTGAREPKINKAVGNVQCSKGGADLQHLLYPVLHLFHFNRLIVDEFSLLNLKPGGKSVSSSSAHAAVTSIVADKKWFLSGTPPMTDFADIKFIANFLGIDLGVDDFTPGTILRDSRDKLLKELTGPEQFLCFQGHKSHRWHNARRELAQRFLDQFARQNNADLTGIECVEGLKVLNLKFVQAVMYQEMFQKFVTYDYKLEDVLNIGQDSSEYDKQLQTSLRSTCATTEEVLIRMASEISLDVAAKGIEDILGRRCLEPTANITDFLWAAREANGMFHALQVKPDIVLEKYSDWCDEVQADEEADHLVKALIAHANKDPIKFTLGSLTAWRAAILRPDAAVKALKSLPQNVRSHGKEETEEKDRSEDADGPVPGHDKDDHTDDDQDENAMLIDGAGGAKPKPTSTHTRNVQDVSLSKPSEYLRRLIYDKLRPMSRAFTIKIRSLRYLSNINQLKLLCMDSTRKSTLVRCSNRDCAGSEHHGSFQVIACCGHVACSSCLGQRRSSSLCVVDTCRVIVLNAYLQNIDCFGVEDSLDPQVTFDGFDRLEKNICNPKKVDMGPHPSLPEDVREAILNRTLRLADITSFASEPAKKGRGKPATNTSTSTAKAAGQKRTDPDDANSALEQPPPKKRRGNTSPAAPLTEIDDQQQEKKPRARTKPSTEASSNPQNSFAADSKPDTTTSPAVDGIDTGPVGYSVKIDAVLDIMQSNPDDKAIVFMQMSAMMKPLKHYFTHLEKIKCDLIRPAYIDKTNGSKGLKDQQRWIEDFQKEKDGINLLVLDLTSEHAAGLNLTSANHLIFFSPLLVKDQEQYDATMLQAIRRAHRFGQTKKVHIYRFAALNTIDINVLEHRERRLMKPLVECTEDEPITTKKLIKSESSKFVQHNGKFKLATMTHLGENGIEVKRDFGSFIDLDIRMPGEFFFDD